MFNNLDAEFYYKNIENMVREQKVEYFISDFDQFEHNLTQT